MNLLGQHVNKGSGDNTVTIASDDNSP